MFGGIMMNKAVLCSLLSVVCFSVAVGNKKINMSRIEAELSKARHSFDSSTKKHQKALSELDRVDLYRKYKEELDKCKQARNCQESSDFLTARAALVSSDSYAIFSPIHHEFIYDELRQHGLDKMVRYVEHNVACDGDDIRSMRLGLDSALDADTHGNLTPATAKIRDRVKRELLDLIELEDSSSDVDSIEKATPKDQ